MCPSGEAATAYAPCHPLTLLDLRRPPTRAHRSNKRYEPRPTLSKADRSIAQYRRWIGQFTRDAISFEEAVRIQAHNELGLPADAAPLGLGW